MTFIQFFSQSINLNLVQYINIIKNMDFSEENKTINLTICYGMTSNVYNFDLNNNNHKNLILHLISVLYDVKQSNAENLLNNMLENQIIINK